MKNTVSSLSWKTRGSSLSKGERLINSLHWYYSPAMICISPYWDSKSARSCNGDNSPGAFSSLSLTIACLWTLVFHSPAFIHGLVGDWQAREWKNRSGKHPVIHSQESQREWLTMWVEGRAANSCSKGYWLFYYKGYKLAGFGSWGGRRGRPDDVNWFRGG